MSKVYISGFDRLCGPEDKCGCTWKCESLDDQIARAFSYFKNNMMALWLKVQKKVFWSKIMKTQKTEKGDDNALNFLVLWFPWLLQKNRI